MSRLSTGGVIDRARPLAFCFDGKSFSGYAGDTLASALLANDVRLIGRSFKYHRPRGILTAGAEEPNALVTLGHGAQTEPNARATMVELRDGLFARSQNRWPSLAFDVMAVNDLLSPILVAGFYYKTFMWPRSFWERLYEPLIRRAAGLGALSGAADPDAYDATHGFFDVLVIGAGPAGLAAALAAGRSGARVCIVEEDFRLGGRLLAERHEINGAPGRLWADSAAAELAALPNVTVLARTNVFGAYDGGSFGAVQHRGPEDNTAPRQCFWRIVAKRAILATGAYERHLLYANNDRPGVMNASAVQTYANRFGVLPGKRIAIYTTSDSGWRVAEELADAGARIAAIIDARADCAPARNRAASASAARIFLGAAIGRARGVNQLRAVDIVDEGGASHRLDIDVLAMAGGWTPNFGLASHKGARPKWDEAAGAYLMAARKDLAIVGAASGRLTLTHALEDGFAAGLEAAHALGFTPTSTPPLSTSEEHAGVRPLWRSAVKSNKAFIDFQHDVTAADVELAAREGYVSVEHMKRYTTLGMATDQGKTSQLIGNALLAEATGKSMDAVGSVIARPPASPITIAALAGHHRGEHFRPVRRTASHDFAAARNAPFVDAGLWKRAQYFPKPGENDWLAAVTREARHVRTHVGVCDVSTLGKIDVHGADAGEFLDRLYINRLSNLAVGKARYGVMLREDGFVLDDGAISRLTKDRYFVTTTTTNAARVMQHIDFCRQAIWPALDVQATSVTEHWAQFAIAGPNSRALLQTLFPDLDLSNEAFPYMGVLEFLWRGLSIRLCRVSFSGELAYEVGVPANYGQALLGALMESGEAHGVEPYGVEAMSVLRIEKGHVAGNELSGQTTAFDLGLKAMMSTSKDYIGRVLAHRDALIDPRRKRLVGVRPIDPARRLRPGAHLLPLGAASIAANDQGYISSAAYSPALASWISLALLLSGPSRIGERMRAYDPLRNDDVEVEICHHVFFDPEGTRLRA